MRSILRPGIVLLVALVMSVLALGAAAAFVDGPVDYPVAQGSTATPTTCPVEACMALAVKAPAGACVGTKCTIDAGAKFTLAVEITKAPDDGYILAQSWINYGPHLTYDPDPLNDPFTNEIVWTDCVAALALRAQLAESAVNHGCLTGVTSLPTSHYVGNFVEVSFNCSVGDSTTKVRLLPEGDPAVGVSGAVFTTPSIDRIEPQVSNLTINCSAGGGATDTPVPTDTPGGPTDTPTPTNAPSPTLAPSTAVPTSAPTPAVTPNASPSPTSAVTPNASPSPTPTANGTAPPTATPAETATPTFTLTPCPTHSERVVGSCATVTPTYTPTPAALAGDTTCDGSVNPVDAMFILQLVAGMIAMLPCPDGGDANGDGVTSVLDATVVLQFSAGMIAVLPP